MTSGGKLWLRSVPVQGSRAAIARRERPGRLRKFGHHQYFWSFSASKWYSCFAEATLVTSSGGM